MSISPLDSSSAVRPVGPPMGPPPGGGPQKTAAAVAEKLGMTTEALNTALTSGSTMSQLAAANGVSQEDLLSTIQATLPSQGPDGVAVNASDMAQNIANGVRPGPPARPEVDVSSSLDALSSALGVSSSDLLERLTSGAGIGDLLDANPGVRAQLVESQSRGALVDGYA